MKKLTLADLPYTARVREIVSIDGIAKTLSPGDVVSYQYKGAHVTAEDEHILTGEQRQRSEAATRAGIILAARTGPFTSKAPEQSDIVHLAHYILTGKHFILDLDDDEGDVTELRADERVVATIRTKEAREAEIKRRTEQYYERIADADVGVYTDEGAISDDEDHKSDGSADKPPYVPITKQHAYAIVTDPGTGTYEVRFPCCKEALTHAPVTKQEGIAMVEEHNRVYHSGTFSQA